MLKIIFAVLLALANGIVAGFNIFRRLSTAPNKAVIDESQPVQSDDSNHKFDALKKAVPANCFIRAHKRLYLSLFDEERSSVMALHQLKQNFLVVSLIPKTRPDAEGHAKAFSVGSLTEIFKFDADTRALARQNPGRKLVFCTGADDPLVWLPSIYSDNARCHSVATAL
jgi:hypothetical protein